MTNKTGMLLDITFVPGGVLINLFSLIRLGIAFPIDEKGSRINATFGIWRIIMTLQLEIRSQNAVQTSS